MTSQTSIFNLSLDQIDQHLERWGESSYRAKQIWHGVYQRLVRNPAALTDLPTELRARIEENFSFTNLIHSETKSSRDSGTVKVLFTLPDGEKVETVLMHYDKRKTVCISSQVGCALGCVFCATGQMGFRRNLSNGEIIEQVIHFARQLATHKKHITNVVVMGMGEPFHNYDAVLSALERLNHTDGFNLGARRITISTVGLVPGIKRFTQEGWQYKLAVSLHAATNSLRNELLPINQRFPLEELIPACKEYVHQSGRRITFEWALIQDVNDNLDQADSLCELIQGINYHVNLIPLNPTQEFDGNATDKNTAARFLHKLTNCGISCTIRVRRGINIQAGCGQLATE